MQIWEWPWYVLANKWPSLSSRLQREVGGSGTEGRAHVSTPDHPVPDEEARDEMLSPEHHR